MRCLNSIALASICALLLACGGTSAPDAPVSTNVDSTYTSIATGVFAPGCALPSCHSSAAMSGGLALDTAHGWANLVGVPPSNDVARGQGLLRVAAGKPDSSFLLVKLTGPGAGEGSRMPKGGSPLTPEVIRAIRAWIAAGAPHD